VTNTTVVLNGDECLKRYSNLLAQLSTDLRRYSVNAKSSWHISSVEELVITASEYMHRDAGRQSSKLEELAPNQCHRDQKCGASVGKISW
jgi:hypothetical protein